MLLFGKKIKKGDYPLLGLIMTSGEKRAKSVIVEKKIPEYSIRPIAVSNTGYFPTNYIKSQK